MSAKLVLLTGATILSLAGGSVGVAAVLPERPPMEAEAPQRQGARVYGIVEGTEDGTVALATPVGAVTLITDANTLFRVPEVEEASLDDFAAGDAAGAVGWWEQSDNVFHAFVVVKLAKDRIYPLVGELTEVGDDTLTVETRRGLATIHVNDKTQYRIQGIEEPGPDDLQVGMKVAIKGTLQADGSLLAKGIAATELGPRQGRLRGEVRAIEGNTLTIRTGRREIAVLTDETTEFRVPGVENPTIADVQVGDRVAGEGVIGEDGGARATLVIVLPEDVTKLTGEVTAVEGTMLVLKTARGPVNILTDGDTVFRIPGIEEPTLTDVKVGNRVTVGGTWEDEATFHALGVGVIGSQRAGARGAVHGRVISVSDESLVVGTPRGPVTVLVDDETRFRVPGVEDADLDDIEEGDVVGVRGTWNEGGSLQAAGIAVMGDRGQPAGKK